MRGSIAMKSAIIIAFDYQPCELVRRVLAGQRTPAGLRSNNDHPFNAARIVSDVPAASLVGRNVGVYQVLELLGAGGMGEVYRARDTRLGRDIALKVLPREVSGDLDRLGRFEREARALATLNHPHIAAIYGVEGIDPAPGTGQPDAVHALVLELVEGETLAQRIRKSVGSREAPGLPIDDVVQIARQITEALGAAHEKGIVHRDLKPDNIKITPEGMVKVLDFGVCKLAPAAHASDAGGAGLSATTLAATREGLILGTAAYMSPEQARGHAVDKRTDVWAFGCVLYEMLTGQAVFTRHTITDTLAAVLEREPDWTVLPAVTPPGLRRLLRRCLAKDAKHRLRDLGDAQFDLEDALAPVEAGPTRLSEASRGSRTTILILVSVGLIALGVVSGVLWTRRTAVQTSSPAVTRTTVTVPAGQELDTRGGAAPLAIAPQGRRIAYVANDRGRTLLYIRSMEAFEAKSIPGTEGAQYPFFSPDGEWVGFFAERKLKRVAVRGGSPVSICDAATLGHGGSWSPDGTIVFDPGDVGLMRVSAAGGTPEPVTSQDQSIDTGNISWPYFLPGGRALVATVGLPGGATSVLAVLSIQEREWHRLGPGSQAQYLPSGHLLYHAAAVREGELHAVSFDAEALTLRGTPVEVIDTVFRAQNSGGAYFAAAQNGTLIFTPGGYARTLVRVDRAGRRTSLTDERRGFRHPEISPDGRRVAVTVDPRPSQVWVYDLTRRAGIPLATNGHNLGPVWSPDGTRITYSSGLDIFWRAADASGEAERLLAREGSQYPTSWSPDGQVLLFDDAAMATQSSSDIWALTRQGSVRPLLATPYEERAGRLSPDGLWLAYHSDESGRLEVHVRPFPDVSGGKSTISTEGGRRPVWSSDGRELFYASGSAVMSVAVAARGGAFSAGTPEPLFSGPFDLATTDFCVTPDGKHFIMVESDPNARPTLINVVLNWTEEVARLVAGAAR
jgi:serine/threonine protein kinase/Tol biopolymer transport system component